MTGSLILRRIMHAGRFWRSKAMFIPAYRRKRSTTRILILLNNICVCSLGLYGVLRPLDLMQPYRLEMGIRPENPRGKDLYQFWGDIITDKLNEALEAQGDRVVVNLASEEYFKSVKPKKLNAELIKPVFLDEKNGKFKVVSFYAKKRAD